MLVKTLKNLWVFVIWKYSKKMKKSPFQLCLKLVEKDAVAKQMEIIRFILSFIKLEMLHLRPELLANSLCPQIVRLT